MKLDTEQGDQQVGQVKGLQAQKQDWHDAQTRDLQLNKEQN